MRVGTILSGDRGALRSHTSDGSKGVKGVARKLGALLQGSSTERRQRKDGQEAIAWGYKHACEPPSTGKNDFVANRANADDGALAEFVAA